MADKASPAVEEASPDKPPAAPAEGEERRASDILESAPAPSRRRRPTTGGGRGGSTHEVISGIRRVKGYPLTRDELFELGGGGLLATTFFSIGGSCIGTSLDIQKSLEMALAVPPELKARWETKEADYWLFGMVLIIIGLLLLLAGGAKLISIIRSTGHPE